MNQPGPDERQEYRMKRKGSLILSEGRSGSNWLVSLSNGTGLLGHGGEWFAGWHLDKSNPRTIDELIQGVLKVASTQNGYFCVKIFPAHVHLMQIRFGMDLLKTLCDAFDVNLVRLARRDRIRQAISYARGVQTKQWTTSNTAKREANYDFDMICRCYFLLERSEAFWNAYLNLRQLETQDFIYEDLLDDPAPFVDSLARHAGYTVDSLPESKHAIQRDATTEEWLVRFTKDVAVNGIVAASTPTRQPPSTLSNLVRLIRGKPLKPYPYTF